MSKTKKVIIIILIFILIAVEGVVLSAKLNIEKLPVIENDNTNKIEKISRKKPIEMCYYDSTKTTSGLYDVAWLKLEIFGNLVSGEFDNLPAEKDSKVGTFAGTVGPLDQQIMARHADVWWNSLAEGMKVKEELAIEFGDGSATVGFGEMVNRGDGVYVYKDKTKLSYLDQMSQIDCEFLDEKLIVEKYIRDNIKTITIDKPVLGGSWYVVSINVVPETRTGEVTYEDGHIQSKATFTYIYNEKPQSIEVTKWEVGK